MHGGIMDLNDSTIEVNMFPVLGHHFAVKTNLQDMLLLTCNVENACQSLMKAQYQGLYKRLLETKDILNLGRWASQQRDEFLHDCLLMQSLRLVLKNIPVPVQAAVMSPHVAEILQNKRVINLGRKLPQEQLQNLEVPQSLPDQE